MFPTAVRSTLDGAVKERSPAYPPFAGLFLFPAHGLLWTGACGLRYTQMPAMLRPSTKSEYRLGRNS